MRNDYITVKDAAVRYGFSQYQIHALVVHKHLTFKMHNKEVVVKDLSVRKFIKNNPDIVAIMRQRTIGDCAFARFLGVNIEELNGEE